MRSGVVLFSDSRGSRLPADAFKLVLSSWTQIPTMQFFASTPLPPKASRETWGPGRPSASSIPRYRLRPLSPPVAHLFPVELTNWWCHHCVLTVIQWKPVKKSLLKLLYIYYYLLYILDPLSRFSRQKESLVILWWADKLIQHGRHQVKHFTSCLMTFPVNALMCCLIVELTCYFIMMSLCFTVHMFLFLLLCL